MKTEIIKNPLTLIAIFAGLSDVAMTAILPSLPFETQKTFMWFVMGYPLLLVCAFFYILIWKREALYAPSDFKDDATWLEILRDTTRKVLDKYPLEPAIATPSETSAVSHQIEEQNLLASNYFYKFLKSLDFTSDDINLIISGADNADDLPAIALKIASNKATSEKIKNVFNEFPRSKDDFYKLKSLLKGG